MEAGWKMKSASKYRVLHVYYLELETGQLTFLCLRQHAESETESPEEHLGANGKLHFHTSSFGKPAPAFWAMLPPGNVSTNARLTPWRREMVTYKTEYSGKFMAIA